MSNVMAELADNLADASSAAGESPEVAATALPAPSASPDLSSAPTNPAPVPPTAWYHAPEGYRETLRLGVPFAGRGLAFGVLILLLVLLVSHGGMTIAVGLGFFQRPGITSVPPAEVPHRFAGHLRGLAPGKGVSIASLRSAAGDGGAGRRTWYRFRLRVDDMEAYRHDVRARWLATPGHTVRWDAEATTSQGVPDWWDLAASASTKEVRLLTLASPDGSAAFHFCFVSDGFVYVVVCR